MELSKSAELKLRKFILKELKLFMKNGTTIEYLENKPEIFYNSRSMGKTLEKIINQVKAI